MGACRRHWHRYLSGGALTDVLGYSAVDSNDPISDFSVAEGDKVDLYWVTFASVIASVAALSDGFTITAQSGDAWTGSEFA